MPQLERKLLSVICTLRVYEQTYNYVTIVAVDSRSGGELPCLLTLVKSHSSELFQKYDFITWEKVKY